MVSFKAWCCYIKPTRYVHESHFRCFEVGYCYGGNKTEKVIPLGRISDVYIADGSIDDEWCAEEWKRLQEEKNERGKSL